MPRSKPRPGRPKLGKGRGREGKVISTRVSLDELARVAQHCDRHATTPSRLLRERIADIIGE